MSDETLPERGNYMPKIGLETITACMNAEPSGKARDRLNAARLRKSGMGVREIGRVIGKAYQTTRRRLWRLHINGLDGKDDKVRNGGEPMLSEGHIRYIDRCLDGSPADHGFEAEDWYAWHVRKILKRKFDITIAARTLRRYLGNLASWCKPRPIPHKSASEEKQAKFIAEVEQLMDKLDDTWSLVFEDESTVHSGPTTGYAWRKGGSRSPVRVKFQKHISRLFGALLGDRIILHSADSTSGPEFIKFLEYLTRNIGNYVIVMDNASSHRSKLVEDHLEANKECIIPLYLPAYTPQLNPIEPQWRGMKGKTASMDLRNPEEMMRILRAMLASGELRPVKIPDHYNAVVSTHDCPMPLSIPADYAVGYADSPDLVLLPADA